MKGNKKGGGGSSRNQTTTTTTEPPAYLRPYLEQGMNEARSLYSQGASQYYPGDTVVGFSPETLDALQMQTDRARAGSPVLGAARDYATRTLAGGGAPTFGGGSNPYASPVATGNGSNPYATSVYSGGPANPYATNNYTEAQNDYGAARNPALDAMFNKAADATQTRLSSDFAGSGRNIAASRPARAEELENLATTIYGGAYENERNRGLEASQAAAGRTLSAYLDTNRIGAGSFESDRARQFDAARAAQDIGAGSYESGQSRALQSSLAAQGIGATGYESERDRMASEIAQGRANQLGVLGLSPEISMADYNDIDRLRGVGAAREDLTGREMEDSAARWDFGQAAPGVALDQYLARMGGYPGSAVSMSTPIYRNPAAGALGGAGMGYQLGNQFGYGGWGALLGGLLGAYGG
jgi:hypothetical protein